MGNEISKDKKEDDLDGNKEFILITRIAKSIINFIIIVYVAFFVLVFIGCLINFVAKRRRISKEIDRLKSESDFSDDFPLENN